MKKVVVLMLLVLAGSQGKAQSDFFKKNPISVGYYGHYIFHPGLKIGTQLTWKEWENGKSIKKELLLKQKVFL